MSIYIAHHRRKSSTELDSKRTVMSTRWKFIWLESSAWQEVVKDWLERFWKECHRHPQQVVKHFGRCLDMIEPNCASCLCFASCLPPTFVWWRCKAPPGRRSIEELGEHHWLVNNLQYITVHPVTNAWLSVHAGIVHTYWWSDQWQTGDCWVWHQAFKLT